MRRFMFTLALLGAVMIDFESSAGAAAPNSCDRTVIVIAHRGASGERPEHTLASYDLAIDQGADYIEPDLVSTKDGVLVARHENEISETTDVADHPEFADRKATKTIDDQETTGWFTEDFTLAELRTLRAKERLPLLRPANMAFDGLYPIPTFDEIVQLVRAREMDTGRRIGLYPETKHPSYFAGIGLPLEHKLVDALHGAGYRDAGEPVFIQSFEMGNLQRLNQMTELRLVQLIHPSVPPYDRKDTVSANDLVTSEWLTKIAHYVDGIGPGTDLIVPRDAQGRSLEPTRLVADAHAAGLQVHPWTFRRENIFLPFELRNGYDPQRAGDMGTQIQQFIELGVDGLFSDNPGEAVKARDAACGG